MSRNIPRPATASSTTPKPAPARCVPCCGSPASVRSPSRPKTPGTESNDSSPPTYTDAPRQTQLRLAQAATGHRLFPDLRRWIEPGVGLSAGAWWSEFGAARWGGGAVDPLGVGRERWRRQPPDNGAGVGGRGGDDLFDALGIALIHQHSEH